MKQPFITKNSLGKLSLLSLLLFFTLSGCEKYYDLIDELEEENPTEAYLYVSNAAPANTLNIYKLTDAASLDMPQVVQTDAKDGNGVVVSPLTNTLYQVGRTERVVKIFNNASGLMGTPTPLTTFADSAMTSGREIALDEARQILYVANNVDSTLLVYNFPLGRSGLTSAFKTLKLSGQPWGIHFDKNNNRLFVLLDLGAKAIEVYYNPANLASGKVTPDRSFKIAGSTRLHGITYSSKTDILIVTEIAAAAATASPDFASDGGIYVFENAKNIIDGNQIEVTPTNTIKGANTLLGNPVDVAFDDRADKKNIYVAEKANKKILVFNVKDNGNVAPKIAASTTESPEAIYLDIR
jgi:DNA-binding beta-propeller fold protein YncE